LIRFFVVDNSGTNHHDGGTLDHLVVASIAIFIGSIVESVLGFGCSLVWMSLFPLFTSVQDAVGVLQPLHIALNLFIVSSIWKRCTPSEFKPLSITVPCGVIFGLWIVTSWSSNAIDCVLGIFLIAYTTLKKDDDDDDNKNKNHDYDHKVELTDTREKKMDRKTSDLELESILDENDFPDNSNVNNDSGTCSGEEEKKDDLKSNIMSTSASTSIPIAASPMSTTMPYYKESHLSPLTHRHHVIENGHGHGHGHGHEYEYKYEFGGGYYYFYRTYQSRAATSYRDCCCCCFE